MKSNDNFQKVVDVIKNNNNFIIFTHQYPDGDGIGSSIAFYKMLKNLGKKAIVICNSEMPYQYEFLPFSKNVLKSVNEAEIKNKYVAIFLDCADLNRVKLDEISIRENAVSIINIDHHLSNTNFGNINIIDSVKSATAEIIFMLFNDFFKEYMDKEIAIGLYTGILTDTGKFQYSNTTMQVHKIISSLLKYDINPSFIYSNIYECEPVNRFKLLKLVFKRIRLVSEDKLIYSYVMEEDLKKLDLPFSSNDGIIELLRAAKNIKVAALFKEIGLNSYKVSLRASNNGVNVADIANFFKGGGHKMAAAYTAKGDLKTVVKNLVEVIENKYRK
ncbi:MAG: bifunctional oligoribonuclease/PAP phosphatase NrnA [Actinomycetota bacterium]|nr:bifunctional oligoribonuclease/PAP phosphatase NrnA [Actinomycetota bacterium]